MSESAPASTGNSESVSSEEQSSGSTESANESNPSNPQGSSAGNSGNAAANQAVVEAIESAEKVGSDQYELIIDGEKVTLTLEEMKAGYQKAKASSKRFQEAAAKEKAAAEKESLLAERRSQMLKNPLKVLMDEGIDEASARKHYEEAVWAWLQQDQMTPEQKAEMKAKKEFETEKQRIAREKEEIENWKKERQAEKEAAEIKKYQDDFATQLNQALTKHNLPQSPSVVSKLIDYMKDGLSYDDSYTFEDAVQVYQDEHQSTFMDQLKRMSPDQLMAALGPDGVKAFRKMDVETNVKNPTPAPKKPEALKEKSKDTKMSSKDFFANLGKR